MNKPTVLIKGARYRQGDYVIITTRTLKAPVVSLTHQGWLQGWMTSPVSGFRYLQLRIQTAEGKEKVQDIVESLIARVELAEPPQVIREWGGTRVSRPVVCLTTGEEYPSIGSAHRGTGRPASSIQAVLLGKHRHTGGLVFCYKEAAGC